MLDFSCTNPADIYYRVLAAGKYELEEISAIAEFVLKEVEQQKKEKSREKILTQAKNSDIINE